MAYKSMWFEFLIIVQCSIYCCGSYGYWEYEDATFSIEEDEINFISSTIDSEDNEINFKSSTIDSDDDDEANFVGNTTQSGEINDYTDGTYVLLRIATIEGSIVFLCFVIVCIISCCCCNCGRTEARGYVVESAVPPQTVIIPEPQKPPVIQHLPPDYTQEPVQQFPSQYQQSLLPQAQYAPMQLPGYQYSPVQQPQYSPVHPETHYSPVHPGYQNPSTLQFFNPPEPPPPYELTAQHK